MFKLVSKLKAPKKPLSSLNKAHFGDIHVKVYVAHQKMCSLQSNAQQSPSNMTIINEEKIVVTE